MAKYQHYVPQTYLKRWRKQGTGNAVYCFDKENPNWLAIGEHKNIESIMGENRLHNVGYEDLFCIGHMPKVKEDWVNKIWNIFVERDIYAVFGEVEIKCKAGISQYILNMEEWEFRGNDSDQAKSKKKIMNQIRELSSEVIETDLSRLNENFLSERLDKFLTSVEEAKPIRIGDSLYRVDTGVLDVFLHNFLLLFLRNPDAQSSPLFRHIWSVMEDLFGFTGDFFGRTKNADWLCQIHDTLYEIPGKRYSEIMKALHSFGKFIVFETKDNHSFVTSDNPCFINETVIPEAVNRTGMFFPVSPDYLVMLGKGEPNGLDVIDKRIVGSKDIGILNRIILNNSKGMIVSRNKYLGYDF